MGCFGRGRGSEEGVEAARVDPDITVLQRQSVYTFYGVDGRMQRATGTYTETDGTGTIGRLDIILQWTIDHGKLDRLAVARSDVHLGRAVKVVSGPVGQVIFCTGQVGESDLGIWRIAVQSRVERERVVPQLESRLSDRSSLWTSQLGGKGVAAKGCERELTLNMVLPSGSNTPPIRWVPHSPQNYTASVCTELREEPGVGWDSPGARNSLNQTCTTASPPSHP